jgi:hypothetical protein
MEITEQLDQLVLTEAMVLLDLQVGLVQVLQDLQAGPDRVLQDQLVLTEAMALLDLQDTVRLVQLDGLVLLEQVQLDQLEQQVQLLVQQVHKV